MNDLLKTPLIIVSIAFLIGSISFINGCKKDPFCDAKDSISGIIKERYIFGCGYYDGKLNEKQFIIDNDSSFQALLSKGKGSQSREQCKDEDFPKIDFSQNTLLGLYADGGGCSTGFERNVTKDEGNKVYQYTIKVNECGQCDKLRLDMNWVLVPKLPQDYKVEFEVK